MNTVFLLLEKREENRLMEFLKECFETGLKSKYFNSCNRGSIFENIAIEDIDMEDESDRLIIEDIEDESDKLIIRNMNEPTYWTLELSEQCDTTEKLLEFINILMKRVDCYVRDSFSDHPWTWDEIEEKKLVYGFTFFDVYGQKYRSGPFAHFGIIDNLDKNKDYAYVVIESGRFSEVIKRYNCIKIPDEMINDWWEGLTEIDTYHHYYNKNPEKALSRWGTTLIPPESLERFIEVIKTKTDPNFEAEWALELKSLLELFQKAIKESKYVIHLGV